VFHGKLAQAGSHCGAMLKYRSITSPREKSQQNVEIREMGKYGFAFSSHVDMMNG